MRTYKFDDIKEPLMVSLTADCGSGSKLYQSLLDGHPEIYMISGYSLMYFYPHWFQWEEEGKLSSWTSIIDALFYNHPSLLDSRVMPGSESLNNLGQNQDEWLEIDKDKFKETLLNLLHKKEISSKVFLLAIHYAYAICNDQNLSRKKILLYHIHIPQYFNQYLSKDFSRIKNISTLRDPRSHIEKRVENSILKPDSIKLKKSDFILFRKRAYRHIIFALSEGFDVINIKLENHKIIKHEDLFNNLEKSMDNTANFLEIEKKQCLYNTTFGDKEWNTTFYDMNKKYKVNPSVVSTEWKTKTSLKEKLTNELYFFDILDKYNYKQDYFIKPLFLNIILLLILIHLPSSREVKEFVKLLSFRNMKEYLFALRDESKNEILLRDYTRNAYYKHKWTNKGLHLEKKNIYTEFLRESLKNKSLILILAQLIYVFIGIIKYFIAIVTYPIEVLKRIFISYKMLWRRLNNKRILPKVL